MMNFKVQYCPAVVALIAATTGSFSTANARETAYSHKPAPMPIALKKIDQIVARAMAAFQVPGIAVGVIKDGKLIFAKGYGVREVGKTDPVNVDTVFQIGSNTKAFTAAALAILVDQGKLGWDDKVIDFLPDFRMHDPYVTREFTIRDLLTHRSGLGAGAGDLMFVPETDMTRDEIIHGLRYLKPVSGFRTRFDYDNLLYVVAGQVVAAVSGQSWESFVEARIMAPLGMRSCTASFSRLRDRSNMASPHVVAEGKLKSIPVVNMDVIGPAGTINCSINGMSKWVVSQLARGATPDGPALFKPERSEEMWTMNTIKPLNPQLAPLFRTHFSGYALGWEVSDVFGRKRVAHTGGVIGTVTWVSMIPELNLGILVFTNQESGEAMQSVGNQILDAYLGAPKRDWVDMAVAYAKNQANNAAGIEEDVARHLTSATSAALPLANYTGQYKDPWRGSATVQMVNNRLILTISRTSALEATLVPYSGHIFVARWVDRSIKADAFVRFEQGFDRNITGITMEAISPVTDFSFDFQDLHFQKVGPLANPTK
jgi:CubicO group peptidase (beta-lactamase class C family)